MHAILSHSCLTSSTWLSVVVKRATTGRRHLKQTRIWGEAHQFQNLETALECGLSIYLRLLNRLAGTKFHRITAKFRWSGTFKSMEQYLYVPPRLLPPIIRICQYSNGERDPLHRRPRKEASDTLIDSCQRIDAFVWLALYHKFSHGRNCTSQLSAMHILFIWLGMTVPTKRSNHCIFFQYGTLASWLSLTNKNIQRNKAEQGMNITRPKKAAEVHWLLSTKSPDLTTPDKRASRMNQAI